MDKLLKEWNETYFEGQLSAEVLNTLNGLALSTQSTEVKAIVERQFKSMKRTHLQGGGITT